MENFIGIYIHIPFCKKKCPYCDFFSVAEESFEVSNYKKNLCLEIEKQSRIIQKTVDTIYIGGGTPSLVAPRELASILNTVKKNFKISKILEITVEINPADYSLEDYKALKKAGITRISLGTQSFFDDELEFLGRRHSAKDSIKSLNSAKESGFENISADLIIGLPYQNEEKLFKTFEFLNRENIKHISVYMLKIEKNTPFFKNKDNLNLPDEDSVCNLYLFTSEKLKEFGYNHYEISNFSKDGFESKHNSKYWNLEEYIGFGPGAHSFINNKRSFYEKSLNGFKVINGEKVDLKEEYIMLKLRTSEGLSAKKYKKKFSQELPKQIFEKAKKYEKTGHIILKKDSIQINSKGFLISNAIISDLIDLQL